MTKKKEAKKTPLQLLQEYVSDYLSKRPEEKVSAEEAQQLLDVWRESWAPKKALSEREWKNQYLGTYVPVEAHTANPMDPADTRDLGFHPLDRADHNKSFQASQKEYRLAQMEITQREFEAYANAKLTGYGKSFLSNWDEVSHKEAEKDAALALQFAPCAKCNGNGTTVLPNGRGRVCAPCQGTGKTIVSDKLKLERDSDW